MIVLLRCTEDIVFESMKKDLIIYEGDIIEVDFTDHGVRIKKGKKWHEYYDVSDFEKNFIVYQ